MATCVWEGNAAAIAQVDKFTPASVAVGDVYKLTMNGKTVSYTAAAATVADVTAGLTSAWNASTEPEHTTLTAADQTTYMTLTADTAGVPFTVTPSVTGTGTLTKSTGTANQSPNDWNDDDNWSGSVPVTGDDVVIENSSVSILYGLDQSAVTLSSLTVKKTFTGTCGLPRNNSTGYVEYLDTYLQIGVTTATIETGGGRFKLDTGSVQTALTINGTGTRAETDVPVVLWKGTHTDNVIDITKGDAGIAFFGGETATFKTLRVGYEGNVIADSDLMIGSNVTHTASGTVTITGGETETLSDFDTITTIGGELTIGGDAAVSTVLNIRGGTVYYESSGTCADAHINGGGVLDFRRNSQSRTFSACSVYEGGAIYDPAASVTWTTGIDLYNCGLPDVTLDLGEHRTWTPSAI